MTTSKNDSSYHTTSTKFGSNPVTGGLMEIETTTDGGNFFYPDFKQTSAFDSMQFVVTEFLPGGGSIQHTLFGSTSSNNSPTDAGGSTYIRDTLKITADDGVTYAERGTSSGSGWWTNNLGNQGSNSNLSVFKNLGDAGGNASASLDFNTSSSGDMAGFSFGSIADLMSGFADLASMHGIVTHSSSMVAANSAGGNANTMTTSPIYLDQNQQCGGGGSDGGGCFG